MAKQDTKAISNCTAFLQWALPRIGFRWPGFRKVRGQVCKRIQRRLRVLGLSDLASYREHLARNDGEWQVLDGLCRITISRFYRDRGVFDRLRSSFLPALCRELVEAGESRFRCLSLGCCGGEEPYTLALIWHLELAPLSPSLEVDIVATDSDPLGLARARRACYGAGSLKDLPPRWQSTAFEPKVGLYRLRSEFRRSVCFLEQDVRERMPAGPFHLVLCRNLVFTYFEREEQRRIVARLAARIPAGGILVLGKHEGLPAGTEGFEAVSAHLAIYRRA